MLAEAPLQAAGGLAQHVVAGGAAKRVVDLLEVVQVDEKHRRHVAPARPVRVRGSEALEE